VSYGTYRYAMAESDTLADGLRQTMLVYRADAHMLRRIVDAVGEACDAAAAAGSETVSVAALRKIIDDGYKAPPGSWT
jgi:hypothetical protein